MYDDDETGAEITSMDNIITLHFVDAKRGDDILTQDNMVVDLGGPGISSSTDRSLFAPNGADGGGSDCFIGSLTQ